MIQWIYLGLIVAFISFVGWMIWDDIGDLYAPHAKACTGCQRHFVKPGCPVHDTQDSRAARSTHVKKLMNHMHFDAAMQMALRQAWEDTDRERLKLRVALREACDELEGLDGLPLTRGQQRRVDEWRALVKP